MTVVVSGHLTSRAVREVAFAGATVELCDQALAAVRANHRSLEAAVDRGPPIYGITTALGALVEEVVPLERAREAQVNLLRSHAAGVGPPLPRSAVRAAIVIRLNSLARAHSGIRPELLEHTAALLNADLVPCVPSTGSLGASGDLAPSAHAFLPLIGEGALTDATGNRLTGAEGLERAGLAPLELQPKEALALINGTHFMCAIGILLEGSVVRLLDAADAAAAMSLDALSGSLSAYDERVHYLRPLSGQARAAANVRALIMGSQRVRLGTQSGKGQDAYSLRCVPQVHGAAREAADFFARLVSVDLYAVTDNPIVFDDPIDVVSAGNFHGQSLALAFDTLKLALGDLAAISERRIFRLLSPSLDTGLPAFLSPQAGLSSGYMAAQYTAAALVTELRALAHPVSVESVPTSDDQEDHVSMGMTAASMARRAARLLEQVLAIEFLCAAQALDLVGGRPGGGVARLHREIRLRVPALTQDRPPADDIEAVAALVREGFAQDVVASGPAGDVVAA